MGFEGGCDAAVARSEPPRVRWRLSSLGLRGSEAGRRAPKSGGRTASAGPKGRWLWRVDLVLELGRGHHPELRVQSAVVEPVDVLERRDLQVIEATPRPSRADELGLEQADGRFGQGIVI